MYIYKGNLNLLARTLVIWLTTSSNTQLGAGKGMAVAWCLVLSYLNLNKYYQYHHHHHHHKTTATTTTTTTTINTTKYHQSTRHLDTFLGGMWRKLFVFKNICVYIYSSVSRLACLCGMFVSNLPLTNWFVPLANSPTNPNPLWSLTYEKLATILVSLFVWHYIGFK